jgi:hypothetical protein
VIPGDRNSANIWPRSSEMPPSRHTSPFAMFESHDHEIEALIEACGLAPDHITTDGPRYSDPDSLHFSNEQLCEIMASGRRGFDGDRTGLSAKQNRWNIKALVRCRRPNFQQVIHRFIHRINGGG